MDIAITGSSGFIGSALVRSLEDDGHRVVRVVRSADPGAADVVRWDLDAGTIDAGALEGVDAVVHLAGEPIAAGPWTAKQRRRIHDSRTDGTSLIARTLAGLDRPPAVLVSGSAIGYYGDRGDERLTEQSSPGDDYLARVCVDWEAAAAPAADAGIRVVRARTGIVLDRSGGALPKQMLPFRMFVGGKAGRGTQWMPWITLEDEVRALRFAIEHTSLAGPVNLTAPNPVTNAEFTRALAAALHRPAVVPVPRAVRHLPFGVGDLLGSLLFSSARVVPDALSAAGFAFHHEQIDRAFETVLR